MENEKTADVGLNGARAGSASTKPPRGLGRKDNGRLTWSDAEGAVAARVLRLRMRPTALCTHGTRPATSASASASGCCADRLPRRFTKAVF